MESAKLQIKMKLNFKAVAVIAIASCLICPDTSTQTNISTQPQNYDTVFCLWDKDCYELLAQLPGIEVTSVYDYNTPPLQFPAYNDIARDCTSFCYKEQRNQIRSFAYAIVTSLKACSCSDLLPVGTAELASLCTTFPVCDMTTNGFGCATEFYGNFYDTSYAAHNLTFTVPGLIIAGVAMDIVAVVSQGTVGGTLTYDFLYGDGSGQALDEVPSTHNFIYSVPGEYTLIVRAENDYSMEIQSEQRLTVVGRISATYDCPVPLVFETGVQMYCPLVMYSGSSVNSSLGIYYEDVDTRMEFNGTLSDAVVFTQKVTLVYLKDTSTPTGAAFTGLVVIPEMQIEHDGDLVNIDVVVTQIGFLKVIVFRPFCGTGTEFCDMNRQCVVSSSCTNPTLSTAADYRSVMTYTFSSLLPRTKVAEFMVYVTGALNSILTVSVNTNNFHFKRGDILGVWMTSTECQIARGQTRAQEDFYFANTEVVIGDPHPLAGSATSVYLKIRAQFSYPSLLNSPQTFPDPGFVIMKAELVNPVNEVNATIRVPVQERISNLVIDVPGDFRISGYEIYEEFMLKCSIATGSSVTYEWIIIFESDATVVYDTEVHNVRTTTQETPFTARALGHYILTVTAFNLLGAVNETVRFGVHRRIVDIQILMLPQRPFKHVTTQDIEYTFQLEFVGGSNVTTVIEWGDGSDNSTYMRDAGNGSYIQDHNHTYHDCAHMILCFHVHSFVGANLTRCVDVENACPITGCEILSNPPIAEDQVAYLPSNTFMEAAVTMLTGSFVTYEMYWNDGPNGFENVSHPNKVFPETVLFSRRYTQPNAVFNASVVAWNSISICIMNFTLLIERCTWPRLETMGGGSWESSHAQIKRRMQHTIRTFYTPDSNIDCPLMPCSYPKWIYLQSINGNGSYYFHKNAINTITPLPKETIEILSLTAADYRIQLVQTCSGISRNYTSFVRVTESPLSCWISGGTVRSVSFKQLLPDATYSFQKVLIDGRNTYDPDLTYMSSVGLTSWFQCRYLSPTADFNAAFTARGNSGLVSPYGGTACNTPNLQNFPSSLNLNSSNQLLVGVTSDMFLEGIEYEFVIFASNGTQRSCNFSQAIKFASVNTSDPSSSIGTPNLNIRCVANDQLRINHQERIIYTTSCPDCHNRKVVCKWEIFNSTGYSYVLNQNLSREVTPTGWDNCNFILNPNVLDAATVYIFQLTYRYEAGTSSGLFRITRKTAQIPYGGQCIMSLYKAVLFERNVKGICQGWQCDDFPLTYQISHSQKDGERVQISSSNGENLLTDYSGVSPISDFILFPLGNSSTIIEVINAYGSRIILNSFIMEITPVPLPFPIIQPPVQFPGANTSTEPDPVVVFVQAMVPDPATTSDLCGFANSIDSALDVEPISSQFSIKGSVDGLRYTPSEQIGLPDGNAGYAKAKTESNSAVREVVLDTLIDKIEVKNLDDCKQIGESLALLTGNPYELTYSAMMKLSSFINTLATQCKDIMSGFEQADQIDQSIKGLIEAASNCLVASTTHLKQADSSKSDPHRDQSNMELKNVARQVTESIDRLSTILLSTCVVGEVPRVITADAFTLGIQKISASNLCNASLGSPNGAKFRMPVSSCSPVGALPIGPISSVNADYPENIYAFDNTTVGEIVSDVASLDLKYTDGREMKFENMAEHITIEFENQPTKVNIQTLELYNPGDLNVTKQKVEDLESPFLIGFAYIDNFTANITCYLQYYKPPSKTHYDFKVDIDEYHNLTSSSNSTTGLLIISMSNVMILDFSTLNYGTETNGSLYVSCTYEGLTKAPVEEEDEFVYYDFNEVARPVYIQVKLFGPTCNYFDKTTELWSNEGVEVDPLSTNFNFTICKTNHLSAFGGFAVAPEPIPALSLDMLKNGFVLLLTVLIILLLYIIALVFARRSDKRDIKKIGVCPLPDNNPAHRYRYEITVFTGMRKNAGTESNVYFIASGELGESKVRHLEDKDRKVLTRNSADSFVFTNEADLGDLSYIRIWHDNSNGGWYLRNILVTDLQREKQYNFLCSRWLSVADDDGQIERVLPVSGPEELSDFNYIFATKTRQDLSDAHLWFSIYARPPRSNFTRAQRLSCCVSLLMTSMMASAMFYRVMPKPTAATQNEVNGITFTWSQVFVSVITACITVPINVTIVTLFRLSRRKEDKKNKSKDNVESAAPAEENQSTTELKPQEEKIDDHTVAVSVDGDGNIEKVTKPKEPFSLPYWAIYFGWILCFISITASSVMVVIYGMIFGNKTSLDWLMTLGMSFFQDVIITQPIKVFIIALFVAAVVKKIEDLDAKTFQIRNKKLASDEEWVHGSSDPSRVGIDLEMQNVRPPDQKKLAQLRELKLKERKMTKISQEIFFYTIFVIVAFSISFSLREEVGYTQTEEMNELFRIKHRDLGDDSYTKFREVYSYNDFWTWMDTILMPVLFPRPWYALGGVAPPPTEVFPGKLFIGDINSKLVNGVRLRQIRIHKDSCTKTDYGEAFITQDCAAAYNMLDEQKNDFYYNWSIQATFPHPVDRRDSPWRYQDWDALDGYPFWGELNTYFGGGYAVELFPKFKNYQIVKNLQDLQWLDRHTRALFIEFSVFNVATNHFSMVTILFEFPPTGGIVHYASVLTFKLYRATTGFHFFVIVCEATFILFIFYFAYQEGKKLKKEGLAYFKGFWNEIEFSIVILSIVAVGFYAYRVYLADQLLSKLPAKKPDRFINFQFAAYWDQVFIYVVALIVFFVTLKFIKLLRFNRRVSMLQSTLSYALKPLAVFSLLMSIVIFSTCLFTNLVFGTSLEGYSTLFKTTASQLSLLLGKFSYSEYEDTNRVLGPIFFLMYNIVVNWILVNMLISIVNDSFATVCEDLQEQSNEYEMVDFMMDRFKLFTGVGHNKKDEIVEDINWQKSGTTADVIDSLLDNGTYDDVKKRTDSLTSLEFYADLNKKPPVNCNQIDVVSEDGDDDINRAKRWRNAETYLNENDDDEVMKLESKVDRFASCIEALYLYDIISDADNLESAINEVNDAINKPTAT